MDAVDFFLTRYGEVHTRLVDGLFGSLSDAQLRARPHPGVNTVAWPQTALLHPYGHYYEGRVAAGLLGSRSP